MYLYFQIVAEQRPKTGFVSPGCAPLNCFYQGCNRQQRREKSVCVWLIDKSVEMCLNMCVASRGRSSMTSSALYIRIQIRQTRLTNQRRLLAVTIFRHIRKNNPSQNIKSHCQCNLMSGCVSPKHKLRLCFSIWLNFSTPGCCFFFFQQTLQPP